MMIETKLGLIDEDKLVYKEGVSVDDENERSTYQEWYLDGELVKRNAHVTLKKWPVASGALGSFN